MPAGIEIKRIGRVIFSNQYLYVVNEILESRKYSDIEKSKDMEAAISGIR